MDLQDRTWKTLEGGHKIIYDVSRPLRRLKDLGRSESMRALFDELWENLHHQGDVGLASYLAVPQLVAICMDKKSLDSNFIGLCAVIENARLSGNNPDLPREYDDLYFSALSQFEKYLLLNFKSISDQDALRLTLALFATINGQPDLGRAIQKMDEGALPKFLEHYKS
jgi:hypothetical protein